MISPGGPNEKGPRGSNLAARWVIGSDWPSDTVNPIWGRGDEPVIRLQTTKLLRNLSEALGLVLAQEALEQAPVALLVVEDLGDHVLGDGVDTLARLDDAVVVVDRPGLGLDHAADHVDDVGLVLGRLEVGLLGLELLRAGDDSPQLLDPLGEPLRVPELLLDVLGQRLLDLLRADTVRVDGVAM